MRMSIWFEAGLTLIIVGCCRTSPTDKPATSQESKEVLTAKRLESSGFKQVDSGFFEIEAIKLGELYKLLECRHDDFGPIPGAGPAFGDNPMEYDRGNVRASYWHLSEETYYTEGSEKDPKTPVKAWVILYGKDNPRPVIKRVISKPGEKPQYEYEPRAKPKD